MKSYYTSESLLQFIYKECSNEEAKEIKKAILTDMDLAKEYHAMLTVIESLNTVTLLEPSQTSIDIILNHATSGVENHT